MTMRNLFATCSFSRPSILLMIIVCLLMSGMRLPNKRVNPPIDGGDYYAARYYFSVGEHRKAAKYLKRVMKNALDTRKLEKELFLNYLKGGDLKKAGVILEHLTATTPASKLEEAEVLAWQSMLLLIYGRRGSALRMMDEAIDKVFPLEEIPNNLLSHLYCNKGVARIFNQSRNALPGEKPHYRWIHRRDFTEARHYFREALAYDDQNATAHGNLTLVEAILSIPYDSLDYGYYRRPGIYDQLKNSVSEPLPNSQTKGSEEIPPAIANREVLLGGIDEIRLRLDREQQVLFLLDLSGSMKTRAPSSDLSRFELMRNSVQYLLKEMAPDVRTGCLSVEGSCGGIPKLDIPVGTPFGRDQLSRQLDLLKPGGGTPLNRRLLDAVEKFDDNPFHRKTILLFSDGLNGCAPPIPTCELADSLRQRGVRLWVCSLLLEHPDNFDAYAVYDCLANNADGELLGVDRKANLQAKSRKIETQFFSLKLHLEDIKKGDYHFRASPDMVGS
jgi:tetratricopeptide (TPR) repeat protein